MIVAQMFFSLLANGFHFFVCYIDNMPPIFTLPLPTYIFKASGKPLHHERDNFS
jgi:hypothetical protein